jgi:ABC-type phosphate/phosphonate transport system ATPase subunit
VASGAAVVVAAHQLELFAENADRAIGIRDGRCQLIDPLPADPLQRFAVLESLSRA